MALSIDQTVALSFNAVVTESRKPANQWGEHAFLDEMERTGMLVTVDFGPQLEETLDYRRNPDAGFLATDSEPTASTKTEVITAAVYSPAQIGVPMVWYRMDEVKNPTRNQKVAHAKTIITNGLESHDDLIEEAMFASSTNGFIGLPGLIATDGLGTVGGILSDDEVWWRNVNDEYQADGSDIESTFLEVWNTAAKGSASTMAPTVMVSGSEPHALYESQLVPNIRYESMAKGDSGFKVLAFKNARYSFSQYGDDKVYFLNPKCIKVRVSKGNFRDLGELQTLEQGATFKRLIYTAIQTTVANRSRLAVASEA